MIAAAAPRVAAQKKDLRAPYAALVAAKAALQDVRLAEAEAGFEQVIVHPDADVLWPAALVGRATCERVRGAPFRALETLRAAERHLAAIPAGHDFARYTLPELLEETVRTELALGLLDRIPPRLEQFRAVEAYDRTSQQFGAAVLEFEVHSARTDPERALAVAQRELRDAALLASQPKARAHFEALAAIARHDLAEDLSRTERRALGERLLALADDPATPASLVLRLRLAAIRTLQSAGQLATARAAAATLRAGVQPDDPQLRLEIVAAAARIELAIGEPEALREVRAALEPAFAAMLEALSIRPLRDGGVGWLAYRNRRQALDTVLRVDAAALGGAAAAVAAATHLEASFEVGTLSRRLRARSPTIDAFRAGLGPDVGALMLLVDDAVAHVIALDRDTAHHAVVALSADDRTDRDSLHAALEHPTDVSAAATVELWRSSLRLGDRLLPGPIRDRLATWRSVILVGDARTAGMFQLLPCDSTWLCVARPVRHVPSLALAARLAERGRTGARPTRDVALIAAPELPEDPGLAPLDAVARLVATITELQPRRTAVKRLGTTASKRVLADADAADASVWCLVTHGHRDYERERYAGLRLAADAAHDGLVYAEDIEAAAVGHVVIAAVCGATSGPPRAGDDGAEHLGGAFLGAGASAVIAAPGDLPVEATIDLLRALFVHLDTGANLASALQRARLSVATRPATAHPWFFSGLTLTGLDATPWRQSR